MTLSNLTILLDRNFQNLDSVSMKRKIKYIAAEYFGKWYWLDETYSIMCFDGKDTYVAHHFVGKREMVILHRLILTGKKQYINPLH